MNIQVGDRIIYKYYDEEITELIISKQEIINIKNNIAIGKIKNLKIERPKYEVVEEKSDTDEECKELLTEEEREFLKDMIKWWNVTDIKFCEDTIEMYEYNVLIGCIDYPESLALSLEFKNIEKDKEYTLSELGLEE